MDHPVLSKEHLKEIPTTPGVYLMMDKSGRVLYVGKARDLRRRLASYQRSLHEAHTKTGLLLGKVAGIDTILTHTEKEALILEASLIKKHRPRYNVILRDDKNYPYLKVTANETWPRLLMTRRRTNDGSRYFGPYASATAMHDTLRYLKRLFPLRLCHDRELRPRARPCLNYQMGRCLAPCAGMADPVHYGQMVADLLLALEGRSRSLLHDLKNRMTASAAAQAYEAAARYRDQIAAISRTLEKQVVVASHFRDQDVFGVVREQGAAAITVMMVREGVINGQLSFFQAEALAGESRLLAEVLERFYGDGQPVPEEIILPAEPEDPDLLTEWLAELKGARTRIRVPSRGGGLLLLNMAVENARRLLEEKSNQGRIWDSLALAIARHLHLPAAPHRLECLDISNLGGQLAVGSLVCFVDGLPEKTGYRHYRIKQVQGPDDYAMIAEVLGRRFAKPKGTGLDYPDLLLIDGGKGQLNIARNVLEALGKAQEIELAALAKGGEGTPDRLFRPGRRNPVDLDAHSQVLLFFMRLRDEAHRFGLTFHRRLRGTAALTSDLDEIPGIGPARKKALLQTLGSMKRVREATVAELAQVPGIGPELAREIQRGLAK